MTSSHTYDSQPSIGNMIAQHDVTNMDPIEEHQKPLMHLMDLPDELLLGTMSFMSMTTLFSIKLVCHHLGDLADQFFYQCPKILKGSQASKLSVALQNKANRVSWVKELLVSTRFGDDRGLTALPPHIPHMRQLEVLRLETPDCNSRKPEERISWIRLQDAYERIFELSSLQKPSDLRLLRSLRECTLHFVDNRTELYSLTKYASLFLHPTLKSLTISCSSTNTPAELGRALKYTDGLRQSTELEHLHLEECDVWGPSLALILSLPKALKSFRFSEGVRYDGNFRTGSSRRMHGNVRPDHLMNALNQTCATTLESLSIMLGHRRLPTHSINDVGQFLNMTAMTQLRSLEIDDRTVALMRLHPNCDHKTWLRFPPNIETLKISEIRLGNNFPFETRQNPYLPLEQCVVKEKVRHGLSRLKTIVFSYESNEDDDAMGELDDMLFWGAGGGRIRVMADDTDDPTDTLTPTTGIATVVEPVTVSAAADHDVANPLLPLLPPAMAVAGPNAAFPLDLLPNGGVLNQENITRAHQFFRQQWYTHANRGRYRQFGTPVPISREFTQLELSKIALLNVLNNEALPTYRQSSVRLVVDMVKLPRGYIPPYLYPEDKPTTTSAWWDSDCAKDTETFKRELKLARGARAFARSMNEQRELSRRQRHIGFLRVAHGMDPGALPHFGGDDTMMGVDDDDEIDQDYDTEDEEDDDDGDEDDEDYETETQSSHSDDVEMLEDGREQEDAAYEAYDANNDEVDEHDRYDHDHTEDGEFGAGSMIDRLPPPPPPPPINAACLDFDMFDTLEPEASASTATMSLYRRTRRSGPSSLFATHDDSSNIVNNANTTTTTTSAAFNSEDEGNDSDFHDAQTELSR